MGFVYLKLIPNAYYLIPRMGAAEISAAADVVVAVCTVITMFAILYGLFHEIPKLRSMRVHDAKCVLAPKILRSIDAVISAHNSYRNFVYSWTLNKAISQLQKCDYLKPESEAESTFETAGHEIKNIIFDCDVFFHDHKTMTLLNEITQEFIQRIARLRTFLDEFDSVSLDKKSLEVVYLFGISIEQSNAFVAPKFHEPFLVKKNLIADELRKELN